MGDKLTPKQERFCQEYIIDFNATQATIRAGYSKKTAQAIGTENLSKPLIQAEIKKYRGKIREKTEQKAILTVEGILQDMQDIKEKCKGNIKYNATALKACELLGKHLGIFELDNKQKEVSNFTVVVNPKQ